MMTPSKKRPNPPTMSDVLDELKADIFKNINCAKVCRIVSYDEATQRASVEIMHKQLLGENPDVLQDYPVIADCPVYVMGGGGTYISHPIVAGDTGIIIFNDRDIERYLQTGSKEKPNTKRKHDLSDALVIVGFRHDQNVISGISNDRVEISYSASVFMRYTSNEIVSNAPKLVHTGDMEVNGNVDVVGNVEIDGNLSLTGNIGGAAGSGTVTFDANIEQTSGKSIKAGNGATGTFSTVTVEDGIVVSGS